MSGADPNEDVSSAAGAALLVGAAKARRAAAFDAGCGRCGYSTRGLTTLICPECGGDFRRVGLVASVRAGRRARRPSASAIRAAIEWTIAVVLMWCALAPAVDQLLPLRREYDNSVLLKSAALPGREFHVTARHATWDAEPPAMQVTVNWTPMQGAAPRSFVFDPVTGNLHDPRLGAARATPAAAASAPRAAPAAAPAAPAAAPLNPTTVLAWMVAAGGADPEDPKVVAEAQRSIGWIVRASRPHAMLRGAGRSTRSSTGGDPAGAFHESTASRSEARRLPGAYVLTTAGLAVAWLAGLRFLWRVRRRSAG